MDWEVIYSRKEHPQKNMDVDAELLHNIGPINHPILRFYEWNAPSLTYGYFIKPEDYLNVETLDTMGLQMGRRPTGGGIVFHLTDLAFSVIIPATHPQFSLNTLENYAFVNQRVAQAVLPFLEESPSLLFTEAKTLDKNCQHFCMAKPTIYDVMVAGKKIGGAAQRRTREGFLHQGTLSLALPNEKLLSAVLKPVNSVWEAMKANSYIFQGMSLSNLENIRSELRKNLVNAFLHSDR